VLYIGEGGKLERERDDDWSTLCTLFCFFFYLFTFKHVFVCFLID
jgi:hypothetical protein